MRSGEGVVSPGPLPRVRIPQGAPIEAFGGGIASQAGSPDLSGALGALDHIAAEQQRIRQEEKARADQVAVTDAIAQRSQHSTYLLHDPDKGALNQFGKNAFGLPEEVRGNYDAVNNVIRNSLANDDQKAAFDRYAANDWSNVNLQLQRHVAAQRQKYDSETSASLVTAKRQEALASFDDPFTVESSIDYQTAALRDHGKRNGLPDEMIAQQVSDAKSATRYGVMQQMFDTGNDLAAVKYFNDHKEDFTGAQLVNGEKQVAIGSLIGESQRHADAIVKTAPSLSDALKATEAIDDPRVRDATETRVRRHFADAAADERQDRDRAFMSLSTQLEQNHGNVDRLKTTKDWLALTPTEHDQLEHRAKLIKHPDEGPGDNEAYLTLLNEAYFNPDQFSTRAIPGEQGLNASQKARLMTLQRSVGARLNSADAAEAKPLLKAIDAANASGDTPAIPKYASALSSDPALDAALGGAKPAAAPAQQAAPVAPPKLKPPTPHMLQDIARLGPHYAAYLRLHGIDAPDVVPVAPEPKKKP
jgi:hypothetical protein